MRGGSPDPPRKAKAGRWRRLPRGGYGDPPRTDSVGAETRRARFRV